MIDKYEDFAEKLRNYGKERRGELAELVNDAADAIEELLKHEWIPVSDRLPESSPDDLEYPTVLGSFSDGSVQLVCYYESTKEWGGGEYFDMKRFPVAWMPLPKPYEGGKE